MFDKWRRRRTVAQAENYIKATDNVSRPIAILMSVAAIIIIAAIVFGLFLGGRWVVDKIRGNNTDTSQETTEQTDTEDTSTDEQLEFPGFVEGEDGEAEQGSTSPEAESSNQPAVPNTGPAVIPDTGPGTSE